MHDKTMKRVSQGVARGEYSLLLGAGASMGALGGNKSLLPSGPQLRDSLVDEFMIQTGEETITLPRAYAAAKRSDPEKLAEFIGAWFTECIPGWQSILADFQWHRIWTLNIDDVVENVYESRSIKLDRFNWTSKHRDKSYSSNQLIHLHGFVGDASDSRDWIDELVFSTNDYAHALMDRRTWHAVFVDEFTEQPFIVLGASLFEEFDLQQALQAGSAAEKVRGLPSIIVLKSVTELQREELEDLGLLVVEADGHDFMQTLHARVQESRRALGHEYGQEPSPNIARFLQQFIDLRKYEPRSTSAQHNFYSGYEPDWRNILNDDDALLSTTQKALSTILDNSQKESISQGIHILTGDPGTGKSTGLLRIARNLISKDMLPFAFRGDEDLDIGAAAHWLEHVPGTVLLFDNCADFAQSLMGLAEECESRKVHMLSVGAERTVRSRILQDKIDQRFLNLRREYQYRLLSERDIDSLINKLESRTRLGRITRSSIDQRRNHFRRTASRRIFDGMANLEGGQGFQARISRGYRLLEDERLKTIYAASSIAYHLGYPMSLGISSKVAGLHVRQLESLLTSVEQDILLITPQGVRPPHRITASIVVDSVLSDSDKYDALYRLIVALAPHVDINAINGLTRHYRLVRQLMNVDTVLRLVGPVNGRDLYTVVQDMYDWNGRYWDQRALFESRLGNNTQARSYAERSLQIHPHAFGYNTLGTVLGRIAIQNGDIDVLRESIENLRRSRDWRGWDISEHPYVTFFSTMNRFGEVWGLASIPDSLRNAHLEWFKRAGKELIFSHSHGQEQLRKFQTDWLSLAVASTN